MSQFRRILHASDFSPASRPAFRRALDLARANRASLTVVHVYSAFIPVMGEGYVRRTGLRQDTCRHPDGCAAPARSARGPGKEEGGPGQGSRNGGNPPRPHRAGSPIHAGRSHRARDPRPERPWPRVSRQRRRACRHTRPLPGPDHPSEVARRLRHSGALFSGSLANRGIPYSRRHRLEPSRKD